MSHEIEMVDGKAQMVYVDDVPWHGLGTLIPSDLAPEQVLEVAGLDWSVEAIPTYANIDGVETTLPRSALVRDRDNKVLDVISNDWEPLQNSEAFAFFNDFIAAGDMEMHTAGSLKDGQIVWALAKVNESFEICGGRDKVDAYLHFTNPHQYGKSIDVRFTPIRVVCNNTLTLSLNRESKNMVKVSHRNAFDPDLVKETLGVAKEKLATYKEMAVYLSEKRAKDENVVEYFKRVFPLNSTKKGSEDSMSRNAGIAHDILNEQPGAEFAEGSWWQAFNAVTFMTDHTVGRSTDTRLQSSWYGANKGLKTRALKLAVEMADAA